MHLFQIINSMTIIIKVHGCAHFVMACFIKNVDAVYDNRSVFYLEPGTALLLTCSKHVHVILKLNSLTNNNLLNENSIIDYLLFI